MLTTTKALLVSGVKIRKVYNMKWKSVKNYVIEKLNSEETIDNKIDYIISILAIYRIRRYGKRR